MSGDGDGEEEEEEEKKKKVFCRIVCRFVSSPSSSTWTSS